MVCKNHCKTGCLKQIGFLLTLSEVVVFETIEASKTMEKESNLLDFIKYYDATSNASLKSLQKFVLSLTRSSLQHLIKCYLIQSMVANNKLDKKTISKTYNQWILNQNEAIPSKLNVNDKLNTEIQESLNSCYVNKHQILTFQQIPTIKKHSKLLFTRISVLSAVSHHDISK